MSIFDIVVLAIIAVAAVLGFFKGVVKSLLRFVEVTVVFALSGLAAMAMVWLKLTDLDALSNGVDGIMESGIIWFIIAFFATYVIAIIFGDYFLNRIVYSRKVKSIWIDRICGMVIYALLSVVMLWVFFAVCYSLEGYTYDIYNSVVFGSPVVTFFYDYNPLRELLSKIIVDNGVTKILLTIIDQVWPNFEYLTK